MAVNDKIRVVDYNSVQTKINNLIGNGAGSSGWGQTVNSSPVSVSNKITVNEWANLRNDIINGFRHINSGTPNTVQATVNSIIKFDNTGTTPEAATQVVVQYDRWADQLTENKFTVDPSQRKEVPKGSTVRNWPNAQQQFWQTKISSTITVTFTTANQARYFFNSGGQVKITTTRTNTSGLPDGNETDQNKSWRDLLIAAGTRVFGAQLPDAGFAPMNGKNFYKLTDQYQSWYDDSSESPYTLNTYRIQARTPGVANNSTGSARIIEFLVELIDGYDDPDGPVNIFGPGDEVTGRFEITVATIEATGILVPASAGNFVVESPQVEITQISGS